MSKIYFLNWHNNHTGDFGPTQIFNNLIKSLDKDKDCKILCPETFKGSFKNLIKKLFFNYLPQKDKCIFVVNGEGLKLPFIILLFSFIFKKHKYFLIYHGLRQEEDKYSGLLLPKYYRMEKILLKNFPNLICVSNFLKDLIIEKCERVKDIYVINNGVYYDLIDKKSLNNVPDFKEKKEFKFIMSGGFKKVKGVDKAIDMVSFINSTQKEFKVTMDIYGRYDNEDYYKCILNSISDNKNINYKGEVDKKTLEKLYKEYDFLVALSQFDSFNMTVLESLSSGTPVIISDNVGACDILCNKNLGYILSSSKLKYGSYGDIIILLQQIYRNKDKYSIMINECLEISKSYNWKFIKNNYIDLFTNIKEGR